MAIYGLLDAFQISKEKDAYKPYILANAATGQAEQAESAATYKMRDMFKLNGKFTEDEIKESCKIYNTHYDDRYNSINALTLELILNNCCPDMFCKITIQLEAVDEEQRGGALALHFIRRAVIRASQENSETIKTALKKLKIKDLMAENINDAIPIIRNAHATLKAAKFKPTKFYL